MCTARHVRLESGAARLPAWELVQQAPDLPEMFQIRESERRSLKVAHGPDTGAFRAEESDSKRPRARKRLPKSVSLLAAAASTRRMRSHQIEPLEGELAASRSPGFGRLKMALLLHAMICTRDIDDEEEGSGRRIDALIIEPRIAPAGGRLAASPRFVDLRRRRCKGLTTVRRDEAEGRVSTTSLNVSTRRKCTHCA